MDDLLSFAHLLGIETAIPFDATLLKPEERIRELCRADRCGNFRKHYMCPPYVGTLETIEKKLKPFKQGVLLRFVRELDVKNDPVGLTRSKLDFHDKILKLEDKLADDGIAPVWGLIGGDCALCNACAARIDAPCPYSDKARTSLESLAIDVHALLEHLGEDHGFHPDRIAWTGCILF